MQCLVAIWNTAYHYCIYLHIWCRAFDATTIQRRC